MIRIIHILIFLIISTGTLYAQKIDNTYSYRSINKDHYTRLYYENDYFSATDEYYTQGIYYEIVHPWFQKLPTAHLLLHPKNKDVYYGLAEQHNAYTPKKIDDTNIRYGERPYAAALAIQFFTIATDKDRKERITTTLSLGLTGNIAGGQWMQKTIHSTIDGVTPTGWHNQISNSFFANYRLSYEKSLLQVGKVISLTARGSADIGLLQTQGSIGSVIALGYFDPLLGNSGSHFQIYAYANPWVTAVGYDATLQGPIINNKSPYTIQADDIERILFQYRYGFVCKWNNVYIEYFLQESTKNIKTSEPHGWGGIQLGVGF